MFDVQTRLQKGFALHQQGRLDEAEKIYGEILRRVPNHVDALHLLGMVAHQKRDYERAVQLISKAISKNPSFAPAYYNRGVALKELKRLDEAIASYDKAITLRPDHAQAYCNRGIALQELKRFEEALASYDKALALKRDFAEAHSNRGIVLHELKRLDEAMASYNKAIALKPRLAEAHFNRGNVLKELDRFEEALAAYDKAIALSAGAALESIPEPAEVCNHRGVALHELRRSADALASFDRAIALRPNFADAYANRARALQELGRAEAALVDCERAIELDPELTSAYNVKGNILNELGRFAQAQAAFAKMIEIDPANTAGYYGLANTRQFTAEDPYLSVMEDLLSRPTTMTNADRVKLEFALAKAYRDIKDRRRSFEHFIAGNAGKRSAIAYDENAALAHFEKIEAAFSKSLITAKSGLGDPSQRPIFILGMPRSGTSLIEQVLASHPMVQGAGELRAFTEALAVVDRSGSAYPQFVPDIDAAGLQSIGQRYLALLRENAPEGERVTDKMPANFHLAGLIHLALPNAKIIHTVRDPIDTCLSCFSQLFTLGQNHTYDLSELGRYYKRYEKLMAHWRSVLPPDRMLDVRYEEVVADLEGQARRLLNYCELPWDDRCLDFHATERSVRTASATQVRQPIYQSSVARWRGYEDFLAPLLEALELPMDLLKPETIGLE
jgi:tetratricopeptide (TPR) repeat protein